MNLTTLKSYIFCVFLLFCIAGEVYGQWLPQHSLWFMHESGINPALSSTYSSLKADLSFRKQWMNLPGSPTVLSADIASPIYFLNAGVNVGVQTEQIGLTDRLSAKLGFAYNVIRSDNFIMSVGLAGSYNQVKVNSSEFRTSTGIYEGLLVNHQDGILPNEGISSDFFGFDAGVTVDFRKTLLNLSVQNVNDPVSEWSGILRKWNKIARFSGQTTFLIFNDYEVDAQVEVYSDLKQVQTNLGILFHYDNNISLGAALRGYDSKHIDAASFSLVFKSSETLRLGYSYDVGLSALNQSHSGSHELGVSYLFSKPLGKGKLPTIIFNPRP